MTHIPEGHQTTSIHHLSVIKGSTQSKFLFLFLVVLFIIVYVFYLGAYRFEILNREFMFSDQLATVISGLYGHDIAEVLLFLNLLLFNNINDFL
jgi:hypothetical protein